MMSPGLSSKAVEKIDLLEERACEALSKTDYFECEQLAQDALERAHRAADYQRMARVLMPLEEARRQKRLLACDAGVAGRFNQLEIDSRQLTPGCWLVEPPLVGADGRELRRQADAQRVPILLLVSEPKTQLGAWPVVMIGVKTVRAYVKPPKGEPGVAWFLETSEALGDAAIEMAASASAPEARIDRLVEFLCTLRDHDALHQTLAQACSDAASAAAANTNRSE